jgi:hypothetical protein
LLKRRQLFKIYVKIAVSAKLLLNFQMNAPRKILMFISLALFLQMDLMTPPKDAINLWILKKILA